MGRIFTAGFNPRKSETHPERVFIRQYRYRQSHNFQYISTIPEQVLIKVYTWNSMVKSAGNIGTPYGDTTRIVLVIEEIDKREMPVIITLVAVVTDKEIGYHRVGEDTNTSVTAIISYRV